MFGLKGFWGFGVGGWGLELVAGHADDAGVRGAEVRLVDLRPEKLDRAYDLRWGWGLGVGVGVWIELTVHTI